MKIYVLLYKEFQLKIGETEIISTVNLKSLRASNILTEAGKNSNIKVFLIYYISSNNQIKL